MKTEIISANHPNAIRHAIDVLRNNGLVAFPTDTVYGLAAPVNNIESINRLYVVKVGITQKQLQFSWGTATSCHRLLSI